MPGDVNCLTQCSIYDNAVVCQAPSCVDCAPVGSHNACMETAILSLHVLWLLWMIAGVILAILGFWHPRLWEMRKFRVAHLIGLLATATVPLWADGVCPLTSLEGTVSGGRGETAPLLERIFREILYWNVPTLFLSFLSALAAAVTFVIFIYRPPWRRSD